MAASSHSWRSQIALFTAVVVASAIGRLLVREWREGPRDARRPALERMVEAELRQQRESKAFSTWLERFPAQAAGDSAFAVSQRGASRLSGSDLLAHARVTAVVYQKFDAGICRSVLLGAADSRGVYQAFTSVFDSLDAPTQREYARVAVAGALAEFRGSPEREPSDTADLQVGLQSIAGSLGDADRARFVAVLEDPRAAPDADVCWATARLFEGAAFMPEDQGVRYVRALVNPAAR